MVASNPDYGASNPDYWPVQIGRQRASHRSPAFHVSPNSGQFSRLLRTVSLAPKRWLPDGGSTNLSATVSQGLPPFDVFDSILVGEHDASSGRFPSEARSLLPAVGHNNDRYAHYGCKIKTKASCA